MAAQPPFHEAHVQYPVVLPLRYIARRGPAPYAEGSGQTLTMSGATVTFTAQHPLVAGSKIELAMDWPACLEGNVALQLRVRGTIAAARESRTVVAIVGYEFRTRSRLADTTDSAAAEPPESLELFRAEP